MLDPEDVITVDLNEQNNPVDKNNSTKQTAQGRIRENCCELDINHQANDEEKSHCNSSLPVVSGGKQHIDSLHVYNQKNHVNDTSIMSTTSCSSIPQRTNRYVLLALYIGYTFLTGCVYWGWNGMQDMLYKSGAFLWRCDGVPLDEVDSINVGDTSYPTCAGRRNAIGDMYTTAFACHFAFSAVAGVLLDLFGPKLCSLLGLSMQALGWILLSVAGESSAAAYFIGAGFIGAGADTAYLPLLSLANLFPKNESMILSVLGAVRSTSFSIPVILSIIFVNGDYMPNQFSGFCYTYVGVGIGYAIICSAFFVPRRAFNTAKSDAAEEKELGARGSRLSVYTGSGMPPVSTSLLDAQEIVDDLLGKDQKDNPRRRSSNTLHVEVPRKTSVKAAAAEKPNVNEVVQRKNKDAEEDVEESTRYSSYVSNLKRPEYLLIVPFFCMCLIRSEFYGKSNKEILVTSSGSDVYELFSIMNILSFIPCPIFGRLCDTIGILWVILILNVDGILMYLSVIFDNIPCKVISILFYFVYTSFCLSNLYCYVAVTFPAEHFGKLTGLASLVGGMFTLLSIGFYRMSTGPAFEDLGYFSFAPALGIMVGFGVINLVLWWIMKRLEVKTSKQKKSVQLHLDNVITESHMDNNYKPHKVAC
eukprot:GHVQ01023057.1.p1 GENE.GHVQ01023057.1~~GHVQ01023057.1.p1  ORF type:complete len:644 (+),score=70.86 GHVQ01023057.1:166-2097(+)